MALVLLILIYACNSNFYGDIDLGSDFYYLVEPTMNDIVTPVNPDKPHASGICVIRNIEAVGFNKDYILSTSIQANSVKYWGIDKTKASKRIGYDEHSNLKLSNVNNVDSIKFYKILNENKIELRTKHYYRKKLNYEQ